MIHFQHHESGELPISIVVLVEAYLIRWLTAGPGSSESTPTNSGARPCTATMLNGFRSVDSTVRIPRSFKLGLPDESATALMYGGVTLTVLETWALSGMVSTFEKPSKRILLFEALPPAVPGSREPPPARGSPGRDHRPVELTNHRALAAGLYRQDPNRLIREVVECDRATDRRTGGDPTVIGCAGSANRRKLAPRTSSVFSDPPCPHPTSTIVTTRSRVKSRLIFASGGIGMILLECGFLGHCRRSQVDIWRKTRFEIQNTPR